jgi:hypothetical protein
MPPNLKSNISSLYMRQYVIQLFACRVANLLAELFLFLACLGRGESLWAKHIWRTVVIKEKDTSTFGDRRWSW